MTGPTIPTSDCSAQRRLQAAQTVRRQDDVAVHEQHALGANGERLANSGIHAACEPQVAPRLEVGNRPVPPGQRISTRNATVVVYDDHLGHSVRRSERRDSNRRICRRSIIEDDRHDPQADLKVNEYATDPLLA